MPELNRALIKNLATDETTYSRGLRYYTGKAIKNISKSSRREHYHAAILGKSEYMVDVDVSNPDAISYTCNCPASHKYAGACKHVVAVLLFVVDYQGKTNPVGNQTPEKKKINQILDYFDKLDYYPGQGALYHIELCVEIPVILRDDGSAKAEVSFLVGNSRMYKMQNIRRFLVDYSEKRPIQLGKEFSFQPGESRFDAASMQILDYLLEIQELQEESGKANTTTTFNKSILYAGKNMLLKLFRMGKKEIQLSLYEKDLGKVDFFDTKPELNFFLNVSEEEDAILLDRDEDRLFPLDESGSLFYYQNAVYHPDEAFTRHFLPFYSSFTIGGKPLSFAGEAKKRFLSNILPRIHETFNLTIPESLQEFYITEEAVFQLYLGRAGNEIRLEVVVCYGEHHFNPFGKLPSGKTIIVRQAMKEAAVIEELESLGFLREKQFYYMKDEERIYSFLTEEVKELAERYELYYSEEFKSIRIQPPKLLRTAVRIINDNNLLEVDFEFEDIPKEELQALLRSLQLKKRYFRLKNGSFLDLEGEELEKFSVLLEKLDGTNTIDEEGLLHTSVDYAFFLNHALEDTYYQSEMEESFRSLMEEIEHPGGASEGEDFVLPDGIQAELRNYQKIGCQWLSSLAKHRLGGILADDMGLGKTLQSIVYMTAAWKEDPTATCLVICPSSLVFNWQDEIESFSPELRSLMIVGTPAERHALWDSCGAYQVVLVSYPIIRRDVEYMKSLPFHTIFLDEAQFIKNPNSQNARSVKQLLARHRFALTGTPIENNLSELWSIFDYVMPGYLHSHARFVTLYEKPIMHQEDEDALQQLNFHIKPFILRRMKRDVLSELPEKIEKKMVSDMTEEQKELYVSYLSGVRRDLEHEIQTNGFEKSRMMILASLTRLRQICCHPSTFVENYEGGSGKMNLLLELLRHAIEGGHRILVFSQFTSMLGLIEEELREEGIDYFYLDGSTPLEKRNSDVKLFNDGQGKVYLISLKAGGTGLNLTGADMVIHYDPWWNPAVEEQATDRVYRIGQKNIVNVMKLITKGTIEEKIYKLQEKKRSLSDSVIQAGELFLNKLTREEVEDLFRM
ncbi:MAG: DEAD/DEAH box helicase [Lachnospiraceae bacterium]|jgi:SNF2 family DNA or RNA helicase|nr:DEAD/DEAH box helicase [Lachnospiraceae bacterium]